MQMKLIEPNIEGTSKKRASIAAVKEIGAVIEQMEKEYFTAGTQAPSPASVPLRDAEKRGAL